MLSVFFHLFVATRGSGAVIPHCEENHSKQAKEKKPPKMGKPVKEEGR